MTTCACAFEAAWFAVVVAACLGCKEGLGGGVGDLGG